MLNPDGVFIGNYRTGIIGDDFNRKFLLEHFKVKQLFYQWWKLFLSQLNIIYNFRNKILKM